MGKQSDARRLYRKYSEHINEKDTFLWLSTGDLKAETENELTAAQTK
jgi:hypothetical protein